MHKIFTLLLLACSTLGYSQSITLKGKVTDPDDIPLESATVYLTSVKDSSVIDYTITGKTGTWELKTRTTTQPVILKISYVSFSDYKQKLETVTASRDFGTLKLANKSTNLSEVVIESETPPIRIKKDTLEFNAASFKVRPDANVETLLKQLPGVDIDSDGTITINGKEVNQILVNGKPFFDADGKIALKNLPAQIINKVQVSDTKTKEEELLNKKASGNNTSINLTIDDKKNKGLFGKIMGGYGTNDRYETSAMLNYFKGKQRISILGSANNINSTGFSMDEIFDSMGGGRNVSGALGNAVRQTGTGTSQGITQSNMIGGSYNDQWFKNFSSNINYFYNSANTANENRTRETTFLPDEDGTNKSLITTSSSKTDNSRFVHSANTEFEWKMDSTATIVMQPKFTSGNSKQTAITSQNTVDQDGNLSNESNSNTFNDTDNRSFSNNIQYRKRLTKKGRMISAVFSNTNNLDDTSTFNKQSTVFYEDANNDGVTEERADMRNQVRYNKQTSDAYNGSLEYLEPVTDSLRLKIKANYNNAENTQNRVGYDFDEATGQYSVLNDALTNYLSSTTGTFTPTAGFDLNLNKYDLSGDFGQKITKFDNHSIYLGDNYNLTKNYILPYASVQGGIQFSKSANLRFNYNYSTSLPSATQILPVEDISNPLNTTTGNPDLDPNKSHNLNLFFRNFDFATRSGYNLFATGTYNDSQVVSYTTIDQSAKRTTSYQNISGTYNMSLGGNWNKTLKRDAHTFRISAGLTSAYTLAKGFTNAQIYEARSLSLIPRFNFNYDYGDLLTINPSYSYTYNQSNYTNYRINQASNYVHRISLVTTSYWPKNVVFGNDFGYTYNSNIADGFKKDFYLWNMSVGYNFLGDHLMFKVKVYDVLNQNLGTSRTITATSIRDEENVVLKRYAMFSLTYSLKQFGPAKKTGRGPGGGGGRGGRS